MIKRISYSLLVFAMMVFSIVLISISHATIASAAEAEAAPKLYCTYVNESGEEVDGNKLTAGTYTINFVAEGFSKLSVVEVTAVIDEGATVNNIISLLSDTNTDLASMGTVNSDGNLVFGFVPDSDYNFILADGAVTLATVEMTFAQDCNAENYIHISENPNLTFITTDYSLENNDEYALVDTFDGYNGALTLMECDVTPAIQGDGYDISGQIRIAKDTQGTCSEFGIIGVTVDVINNGDTIASAVTDKDGNYTLSAIPAGEYTMSIHGDTTVDREVTLVVSESKNVSPVGIVICDYTNDNFVNTADLGTFVDYLGVEYYVYADLNTDGYVNTADLGTFIDFLTSIQYADVTLN